MDKPEIVTAVVETIAKVQGSSGRPCAGIGASTRPIGGVEGFDSLSGVEATVILSESLGVDIPINANPFMSEDGRRALSISEIADTLSTHIGSGG